MVPGDPDPVHVFGKPAVAASMQQSMLQVTVSAEESRSSRGAAGIVATCGV